MTSQWPKKHIYDKNKYCGLCNDFSPCTHNNIIDQCREAIEGITEDSILDELKNASINVKGDLNILMAQAKALRQLLLAKVGK